MPKIRNFPKINYKSRAFSSWRFYYHKALEVPSWVLVLTIGIIFLLINIFFAAIYFYLKGLVGAIPLSFIDHLYFSVVTFTTLGYGDILPIGWGRLVANFEVFCGLFYIGVLTGLLFARFSRASSPFIWSQPVVLNQHKGQKFIQVRVANVIGNDVINVMVKLFVQRFERSANGVLTRKLIPVKMEHNEIPIAAFSWELSHKVDKSSPLKNWANGTAAKDERLIGFIHGYDSTVGREAYGYARWQPLDLVPGEFKEVISNYSETEDLRVMVDMDLDQLDVIVPQNKK